MPARQTPGKPSDNSGPARPDDSAQPDILARPDDRTQPVGTKPSSSKGRCILVLLVIALIWFAPLIWDVVRGGGNPTPEPAAASGQQGSGNEGATSAGTSSASAAPAGISAAGASTSPTSSDGTPETPWYESIPEDIPVVDFRSDPNDPTSNDRFLDARDELYRLIDAFTPEVYVIGLNPSWSFFDPSQFWLEGYANMTAYSYDPDDEHNSTQHGIVSFSYNCTPEERDAMQAQVDAATQEILACIPADADDWTAALVIYDELVRRITYDPAVKAGTGEGSLHCQDIYGALVERNAVCMGYAYAFDHLCELAGVAANLVLSDDGTHIYSAFAERWDDGSWHWCFVDPTWGDIDQADAGGRAYVDHSYFGVSEEEIERYESHDVRMSAFIGYDASLNWHVRTGAYLYDASYESMRSVFAQQYAASGNCLEVRFDTDEAYRQACDSLFANDCATLHAMLGELGCDGALRYWTNDTAKTICVGLNAAL